MEKQSKELKLEFDLPDFSEDDIHVSLKDGKLEVKANKQTEKKVEREGFFHDEKTKRDFVYFTDLNGFKAKKFDKKFNNGRLVVNVLK